MKRRRELFHILSLKAALVLLPIQFIFDSPQRNAEAESAFEQFFSVHRYTSSCVVRDHRRKTPSDFRTIGVAVGAAFLTGKRPPTGWINLIGRPLLNAESAPAVRQIPPNGASSPSASFVKFRVESRGGAVG